MRMTESGMREEKEEQLCRNYTLVLFYNENTLSLNRLMLNHAGPLLDDILMSFKSRAVYEDYKIW